VDSTPRRTRVIDELRTALSAVARPHPLRVAVDGVGAAGKTILADELARALGRSGRPVIRAGIDGFHNPRKVRHARGSKSPWGYYLDSFDYAAVARCLLEPLGPLGNRRYRTAVYDFRADAPVEAPELTASSEAILVFDGVFLLRPQIRDSWDFSIFIDADFEVTVGRALVRDVRLFGTPEAVRERYAERYVPGERLYLEMDRPRERADAVVQNDDPSNPTVEWRGGGRTGPMGGRPDEDQPDDRTTTEQEVHP
jgi:uridine kinase